MIVAIVGSRGWLDPSRVRAYVAKIAAKYPDATIVSGGARGVDTLAEFTARHHGLTVVSFRPAKVKPDVYRTQRYEFHKGHRALIDCPLPDTFKSYGACAFYRNRLIVDDADVVVAFHHGESRGTAHSIRYARESGKPVYVYTA